MILMRLSSSPPHFTPPPATQVVKSDTQRSGVLSSDWLLGVPSIPSKLEDRLSSKVLLWLKRQIKRALGIDSPEIATTLSESSNILPSWHEVEAPIKQLYTEAMRLSNLPNPHNHTVNQMMRLCGSIYTEVEQLGKSHTLSSKAEEALAFAERNRYKCTARRKKTAPAILEDAQRPLGAS